MSVESHDDPAVILGLSPKASDEEIRAAYLKKVKEHPPDRDPEAFEKIRDAYERASDPQTKIKAMLFSDDPSTPLAEWLDSQPSVRKFVGPRAWLDALRER